jgi:hypothetical protein
MITLVLVVNRSFMKHCNFSPQQASVVESAKIASQVFSFLLSTGNEYRHGLLSDCRRLNAKRLPFAEV